MYRTFTSPLYAVQYTLCTVRAVQCRYSACALNGLLCQDHVWADSCRDSRHVGMSQEWGGELSWRLSVSYLLYRVFFNPVSGMRVFRLIPVCVYIQGLHRTRLYQWCRSQYTCYVNLEIVLAVFMYVGTHWTPAHTGNMYSQKRVSWTHLTPDLYTVYLKTVMTTRFHVLIEPLPTSLYTCVYNVHSHVQTGHSLLFSRFTNR